MTTTLTDVRQYMTVISSSADGIDDSIKHLQKHLSENGLITEDAQYFIDGIKKYSDRIKGQN